MSTPTLHMSAAIWRSLTHRVSPASSGHVKATKYAEPSVVEAASDDTSGRTFPHTANLKVNEHILTLVRRIFFSSCLPEVRHVVFSPIENDTDIGNICQRAAEILARQVNGDVCYILPHRNFRKTSVNTGYDIADLKEPRMRISPNLWEIPGEIFASAERNSVDRYSQVLKNLRHDFQYSIIQGSLATDSESVILGKLCDGVVLVLRANQTRRIAAKRAQEILVSADVRILGTILSDREFPIPEAIYRRF